MYFLSYIVAYSHKDLLHPQNIHQESQNQKLLYFMNEIYLLSQKIYSLTKIIFSYKKTFKFDFSKNFSLS